MPTSKPNHLKRQDSNTELTSERDLGVTTPFWWWAAGADKRMLKEYSRADSFQYTCIGVAVLLTAITAALTGGFALYVMFRGDSLLAVIFGLLWGAIIFNFDRLIVSNMHKEVSDESRLVKLNKELLPALPRLLLAFALGLGLARPAELRFFQPEIEAQLKRDNLESAKAMAVQRNQRELDFTHAQTEEKQQRLKTLEIEVEKLRGEFTQEMQGTGGSGRYGYSIVAQRIEFELKRKQAQYSILANQISAETRALDDQRKQIEAQIAKEISNNENELYQSSSGFLARTAALDRLKNANTAVKWTSWFITFLICLIEIMPVLIKLLSPAGRYERERNTNVVIEEGGRKNRISASEQQFEIREEERRIKQQFYRAWYKDAQQEKFRVKSQELAMDGMLENQFHGESLKVRREKLQEATETFRQRAANDPEMPGMKWRDFKKFVREYFFDDEDRVEFEGEADGVSE